MKPIIGYMVALLIGTLIVAAVPWISGLVSMKLARLT